MKAIAIEAQGPDYHLVLHDAPVPAIQPESVLIRSQACGVNRADILQALGYYPPPAGASPILGLEISGTAEKIGEKVHGIRPGDAVCALLTGGGYADYALADASCVLPVPKTVALPDAAALPEALFTAYANLDVAGRLQPGETVLIHGGASGVGVMAIQICVARGHRVFATARQSKCAAIAALGAEAIAYDQSDFVEAVLNATAGKGADVILDMVGGDYIARNMQAAAFGGRIVNIAYQKGGKAEIDGMVMLQKQLVLTATALRGRSPAAKGRLRDALQREIWPLIEAGRIKPLIDRRFALADAAEAHRHMRQGGHSGKILLLP